MKSDYRGKMFDNTEDFLADLSKFPKNILIPLSIFFKRARNKIWDIKTSIRHAWQRLLRGWDDSVVWSIDYYLAKMLPIWLKELKRKSRGAPISYFPQNKLMEDMTDDDNNMARKKWFADLDIIIAGFTAYKRIQDMDYDMVGEEDRLLAEFNTGMRKLAEIFETLWW